MGEVRLARLPDNTGDVNGPSQCVQRLPTRGTAGDVFGCRAGGANCGDKAGPDFDFGTPPMLIARADRSLLDGKHERGKGGVVRASGSG